MRLNGILHAGPLPEHKDEDEPVWYQPPGTETGVEGINSTTCF
jgi:hypothetical protein